MSEQPKLRRFGYSLSLSKMTNAPGVWMVHCNTPGAEMHWTMGTNEVLTWLKDTLAFVEGEE